MPIPEYGKKTKHILQIREHGPCVPDHSISQWDNGKKGARTDPTIKVGHHSCVICHLHATAQRFPR